MLIDPLPQRTIGVPQEGQDLTARCLQTILLPGGFQEADPNRTRDGVDAQGIDRCAAVSGDGVDHEVRCG